MRFSAIIAFALSAVAVSAHNYHNGTETTVTEIVTQYTTYCPFATTIVENNKTYTVTEATTLTISNCPCTRTKTYTTVTSSVCPGGCGAHGTGALPTGLPTVTPPAYTNATGIVKPTSKTTAPAAAGNSSSTAATPSTTAFEGSANKATVAAGALAGLIGVAAYLL
jgi:hypothetical protein